MYPILQEDAELITVTNKRTGQKRRLAELDEERYELTEEEYRFLKYSDGRHRPQVDPKVLKRLTRLGLVQTNRYVFGLPWSRLILLPTSVRIKRLRPLAALLNRMLPAACLLMLAAGILSAFRPSFWAAYQFSVIGYIIGMLASVALHEVGHLNAAITYRQRVRNMGLLMILFVPIGAYVCYLERPASRRQKIQLALAGCEMNLLLCGGCLLLQSLLFPKSMTLLYLAFFNLVLCILNLLPCPGLDGEAALSRLLGIKSVAQAARNALHDHRLRRQLFHSGASGYACLGVFSLVYLSRLLMLLLNTANIVYAIYAFLC